MNTSSNQRNVEEGLQVPCESARRSFNWRGFFSLLLFCFFVFLALSGIVLYAAPQCWVAEQTGWAVLGLSKDQWSMLHMTASLVVLVAAGFHLYYNWTIFWAYIRKRSQAALNLKREMALVVLVCVVALLGTIYSVPPFRTLLEWNEAIKVHWRSSAGVESGRHGREHEIGQPAEEVGVPQNQPTGHGAGRGGSGRGGGGHGQGAVSGSGQGHGRMTVQQSCESASVPIDEGLARLKEAGIEATSDESLRAIAQRSGKTPGEIAQILDGK